MIATIVWYEERLTMRDFRETYSTHLFDGTEVKFYIFAPRPAIMETTWRYGGIVK